jgi:hypothetical protein
MYRTGADAIGFSTGGTLRMHISNDGNVTINSSSLHQNWDGANNFLGLQCGTGASFFGSGTGVTNSQTYIGNNCYYDDVSNRWEYIGASEANLLNMNDDGHLFYYNTGAGAADGAITWANRLTILNNGKVGIGTGTVPTTAAWHFSGSGVAADGTTGGMLIETQTYGQPVLRVLGTSAQTNDAFGLDVQAGDGTAWIARFAEHDGTERMRITGAGNVGIGDTDPPTNLQIKGTGTVNIGLESTDNAQDLNIDYYDNGGAVASRINYSEGPQAWNFIPDVDGVNTSALTIINSGNVGIGVSNPGYALVVSSSNEIARFMSAETDNKMSISFGVATDPQFTYMGTRSSMTGAGSDPSFGIYTDTNNNFPGSCFHLGKPGGTAIAMTVSSSTGFIGMGTVQPSHQLDVEDANTVVASFNRAGSSGEVILIQYDGSTVAELRTDQTYNYTSDYRLKENIEDLDIDALARVNALKPRTFNFKKTPDIGKEGFIAHEVEEVISKAVKYEKDGVDDEGNPKYQMMNDGAIIPTLVKSIQELSAKVESLEAQVSGSS